MRLLLAEDEIDLGAGIKRTLVQQNYTVDWAKDGQEAIAYWDSQYTEYDLIIIDWMLPKLSGLDLCKYLRKQGVTLPILMLTARDKMEDRVTGLDAGADDYLVKPFGIEELLARLRALSRRCPQYQPQVLQVGDLILDYSTRSVSQVILTNKEFQILEYLMRHPHQILTTEQIRNQIWELDSEAISNVVAAQIRLLRKKLALINSQDLIETVYGVGYRLKTNGEAE